MSDILALAEDVRVAARALQELHEEVAMLKERQRKDAARVERITDSKYMPSLIKMAEQKLADARKALETADDDSDPIESLTPDETRADIEAEDAKMDGLDEEGEEFSFEDALAAQVAMGMAAMRGRFQDTVSEDDGEVESVTEDVLVSVTDARGEVQQSWTDTIMACSDGRTYKNGILQDSETEATDTSEQSYTSHGE